MDSIHGHTTTRPSSRRNPVVRIDRRANNIIRGLTKLEIIS